MALLGDSIDPRLFLQDFGGFAKAGQTTANGIESAIGTLTSGMNERSKEQKEAKNVLKASQAQIDAAINLFPDQAKYLGEIGAALKDEDTPLTQRAAIGAQTADFIAMAVGQKRYETEQDWRAKDLDLRVRDQGLQEKQSEINQQISQLSMRSAENELANAELDTATKATIGPAILDSVLAMAPAGIRKDVTEKIAAGEYTDQEKFSLANSIQALIPKSERAKAPTVLDVAVPGGKQQVQWDETSGKFVPIQAELMQPEIILPAGVAPQDGMVLPPKEGTAVDGYGQPTENIQGLPAINGFPAGGPVGFTPTVVDPQLAIQQEKMAKEKKDAALQAQQNVDKSKDFIKSLDALEKHPGFSNLFGTNVGVPTWIPGSAGADAKAVYDQIQGKGFLEAIQSMKGMGALSNAEGEKVSAAFLGLKPGMSEAAAKKQIEEAKSIIKRGIENAAKIQPGVSSTETAPVDPYAAATSRLRGLVTPK